MQRYPFCLFAVPCTLAVFTIAACSASGAGAPTPTPQPDAGLPDTSVATDSGAVPADTGPDVVPLPKCDESKPFGAPVHMPDLPKTAYSPSLSDDELTIIYSDDSVKNPGVVALFEARRANFKAAFGKPNELSEIHASGYRDETPRILLDGKTIVFASNRPGGTGTNIISGFYIASRPSAAAPFELGGLLEIPAISGSGTEFSKEEPFVSRDGSELWFHRTASNPISMSIWVAPISTAGVVGSPVEVLTGDGVFNAPILSVDGLSLYFTDNDGAATGLNAWKATRPATNSRFLSAKRIAELSTTGDDRLWHITPDGCRAYLRSTLAPAGIFVAAKPL